MDRSISGLLDVERKIFIIIFYFTMVNCYYHKVTRCECVIVQLLIHVRADLALLSTDSSKSTREYCVAYSEEWNLQLPSKPSDYVSSYKASYSITPYTVTFLVPSRDMSLSLVNNFTTGMSNF